MTRTDRPTPTAPSRDERLRAALRANLARRKAQARSRADDAAADAPDADGPTPTNSEAPAAMAPPED